MLEQKIIKEIMSAISKNNDPVNLRDSLDSICQKHNTNIIEVIFNYRTYNLESCYYYLLCEILNNTLSFNDNWLLNKLNRNNNCMYERLRLAHMKALIFSELSILELEIHHQINHLIKSNVHNGLSISYQILNTYKNEVFNLRKKIKPSYLLKLSHDFINKLNSNTGYRERFRLLIENLLLSESLPKIKKQELENKNARKLLIILEEVQEKYNSTVNKLIFDWVHCICTYTPEYEVEILVTNDIIDGIIPGVGINENVDIIDLLKTLDLSCNGKEIKVNYRKKNESDILQWISKETSQIDLLGVVLFPSPRWPMARLIKEMVPTVAVELANGVNLNSMADVVLPNGIADDKTISKYGNKLFEVPFPQIPFPKNKEYRREDLNLSNDDFLVVSVGRQLFSRSIISINEYFSHISNLIMKEPNIKWIFVGEELDLDNVNEDIKRHVNNKKIIILKEESDLMALYSICDLFAMPPIRGGGRGIGLAASSGLPCISFNISDGSKSFPNDLVFNTNEIENYFEIIYEITKQSSLYSITSEKCKKIFTHELFEKSATGLIKALEKANGKFNGE